MESIDVVFYINLEHRTDRKEHFLSEIQKLCPKESLSKVRRIDAVHNGIGSLGCAISHVMAMEEFYANPEWNTCAVFEDDYTFHSDNLEENNRLIQDTMTQCPDWDMITLAFNPNNPDDSDGTERFRTVDTPYPSIKRVLKQQTASGYILTRKYLPILATNFAEAAEGLQQKGNCHEFCLDIYWQLLQSQPQSQWYCIYPALGYQYANFSDIERHHTEYKC